MMSRKTLMQDAARRAMPARRARVEAGEPGSARRLHRALEATGLFADFELGTCNLVELARSVIAVEGMAGR